MTTSCSSRSCPPAGALSVPGADHPTGCTGKPSLDYRFVSGTIIEGTATGKSRLIASRPAGLSNSPNAMLKRDLWNRRLSLAYGADVGGDSLFLQHTYLVIVAKAVVWAAMIESKPESG